MAQRLPSIKDLVDQGLLSDFETTYIRLANGKKRLALIVDRGEAEDAYYQGGQFVDDAVIEHLEAVRVHTVTAQVSSAVSQIATQAVINTVSGATVQVSKQLSSGLFQLGELLEDAMSDKTYASIFKQLNVLGEAVLMSTDKNAGRWWIKEHGVRPGTRYTGYLFGGRNVVTGVVSGGGKGFEWPDIGILDKEVQHWRVIEFGNREERMMPKGFIYPHHKKGSTFTDSQFTFRKPKLKEESGKGGRASDPVWTGPLGFGLGDAEEPDPDDLAARAQRSAGMMVKNRPKYLFATVRERALIDDKVFGLFEDITQLAYTKAMREQQGATHLDLQEIENKVKQRITL